MTTHALKQIVTTAAAASLLAALTTVTLLVPLLRQLYPPSLVATIAAGLLVLTVLLQWLFLLVQALPGGRRIVTVRWLASDGWLSVLIFAQFPALAWEQLGQLAGQPFLTYTRGLSPPFFLGIFLLIGRIVQVQRELARERA